MCTKRITLIVSLLFSAFFALAQTPTAPVIGLYNCGLNYQTPILNKVFNAYLYDFGVGIMTFNDGSYLMAGTSESYPYQQKTAPNKGGDDYWIIKSDASGNIIWDKSIGGDSDDLLREIIKTNDGNFILAGTSSSGKSSDKSISSKGGDDYWIVKIDVNGNKIWDMSFGGEGGDVLRDIIPTEAGGFFLGGYSDSPISGDKTSSKGGTDYWVVKIDSSGNKIWDKTFGGADYDYLHKIERTGDNNFLLAGSSYSTEGGDKSMPKIGANDIWLLKIDIAGNILWQKQYGGSGFDGLGSVKKTSDNGFILACNSSSWASADKSEPSKGFDDFWVIRIDANGNKIWDRTYGGNWEDRAFDLEVDTEGNSILAGWTQSEKGSDVSEEPFGSAGSDYDIWMVKLDKNGNKLWDKRMGSNCVDIPATISRDSDGNIVVVGAICNDYWIYKFSECSESAKRSFCGDEDIILSAKNCTGTIDWSNGKSGIQITVHPTENTNYWATCTANGIKSPVSNTLSLGITPHESNLTGTATKSAYQSTTSITSGQIINNRVSYKAGNFIILGIGFKVENTGIFETAIEGCSN